MRKKRNIIILMAIVLVLLLGFAKNVQAEPAEEIVRVTLSDESILVNDQPITETLGENVYLSRTTNNGGASEEAINANISIANIVNISKNGTYEFTGNLSNGQIAIDANNIVGNVTIILNNVNINCPNAPAIFIYNKSIATDTYTAFIRVADGTTNTISGGHIKQSVENWENQANLLYYIDKGYDDDNSYYERYKYDGAISSDISLNFEGKGTLTVNGSKEGIESKRHITINSGNYIINSLDDGINACTEKESIITINDGIVLVNVLPEAQEGDGIDSNGLLYINEGKVFAFASEKSQDNGLDSSIATYINGGYVVGTGNMFEEVSDASEQAFMQMQFKDKITKGTLIAILDENKNPEIAFRTNKEYSILTVSSPKIKNGEHYVYEGGNIQGTNENGLYTTITSYDGGTEKEYNTAFGKEDFIKDNINDEETQKKYEDIYFYIILGLATVLIILVIITILLVKTGKVNIKGNVIILFIGMILGIMITIVTIHYLYNHNIKNNNQEQNVPGMEEHREIPMDRGGEKNPQMPMDRGGEGTTQMPPDRVM